MTDEIAPAKSASIASLLRNPLVICGLILVAGDGPLTIAYVPSIDPYQRWALLVAMILFIFAMGAVFRHLL